jgi:hypothetical protein
MVESVDQRPVRLVAAPDQLGDSHGCGCCVARGRGLDVDAHRHVPVPREVQDRFEASGSAGRRTHVRTTRRRRVLPAHPR